MPACTTSFVVLATLLPLAAALDPHRDVEGSLDRVEAALNLELEHVAPRTHLERWFPSLEKRALGYDPKTKALTAGPAGTCSEDISQKVTACLQSVDTCDDVFINVEGSQDDRRRANSMNNMEYFGHTRRCSVFFADTVEVKASGTKLLKPEAVGEKYGILEQCLLPTRKCAVKQMLAGLAAKERRVLLMVSTHGGLVDKKAAGSFDGRSFTAGYGNYVVFGKDADGEKDHITKADIKEWIVGPFCGAGNAVLVVVWSACFSGGYYASLKTKDGVKVKKSNEEIFNWWANSDKERDAKLDNLSEIEMLMSPSTSYDADGLRGGACPGQDPDDWYSRDGKRLDPGARKANVFFYTASFPHLPAVSYGFDEDAFGKKGSVRMGGNALHTAFRLVIDEARAKLDAEGDVISEGTDYSPIQMKFALQNELIKQIKNKSPSSCRGSEGRPPTFDLKCCETDRRANDCTHTVEELPVVTKGFTMAVTDELIAKWEGHASIPQLHGKKQPKLSATHSYELNACLVNVEDKCPASHPYPQDQYLHKASKDAKWHLLSVEGFNFYPWLAGTHKGKPPYPVAGYACDDPANRKAFNDLRAAETLYTESSSYAKEHPSGRGFLRIKPGQAKWRKQNEASCKAVKASDKPLFDLLGFRSINDCCASFLLATPSTYDFYAEDGLDDQQNESVGAWMTQVRETAEECTAATDGKSYWKAHGFGDAPLALGGMSGLTDCIMSKRLGDY